jgi:hypothetical protein
MTMSKKKEVPEPYRILVTGARDWKDKAIIRHALFNTWQKAGSPKINSDIPNVVLIVGRARGADTFAEIVGEAFGFTIEPYEADWEHKGKGAGPQRNQQMVNSGADICLAFLHEGSKGTADCIKRAEKAEIPVEIYRED